VAGGCAVKTQGLGVRNFLSQSHNFCVFFRSGGGTRPGFEGGQTPLYRRLPKYVGKPHKGHKKTVFTLIKLEMLNAAEQGSVADYYSLRELGVATKINKQRNIFKVVGGGELTKTGLTVRAHAFTESARAAIEAAGGSCVVLSRTKDIPLEQAIAEKAEIAAAQEIKRKELRALKASRLSSV